MTYEPTCAQTWLDKRFGSMGIAMASSHACVTLLVSLSSVPAHALLVPGLVASMHTLDCELFWTSTGRLTWQTRTCKRWKLSYTTFHIPLGISVQVVQVKRPLQYRLQLTLMLARFALVWPLWTYAHYHDCCVKQNCER